MDGLLLMVWVVRLAFLALLYIFLARVVRSFDLDAITTLGRDVNNAIVVEDPFASADHAVLTYRGRSWYVEDLGSTNGTYVNGRAIASVAPLGFGDELSIGQVRLRLERARSA
jgi:pSer/pThr/pTyr-binding forkhead associated (FHA) protein